MEILRKPKNHIEYHCGTNGEIDFLTFGDFWTTHHV